LEDQGFDATTTPGGTGQFDVLRDGALVYSKQQLGRFPDDGEVLAALGG
jgi:predicted Rdx family selenoprotein